MPTKEPSRSSPTLASVIHEYAESLAHEQHASRSTQVGYRSALNRFRRFLVERCGREPDIAELTSGDVRDYFYSLSRKGLRPRTLRGALGPVKNLFTLAVERGYRDDNPTTTLKLPKKDAALRATVSEEEIAKLVAGVERVPDLTRRAMARALIAVLVYTAIRRQELLDMEVGDVDLNERRLTIRHGKGDKRRAVPLGQDCARALREWLAVRGAMNCKHAALFLRDRGRKLGENGLTKLIEEVRAISDLREATHITPHALRHAAATRMLRNGADLRSIQHVLGHTSIHTTQVYLHTDDRQLQHVAELTALGDVNVPSLAVMKRRRDERRERPAARPRRLQREDRRRR